MSFKSWPHLPSVPTLLSALVGLGSLTLGIVAFDAERLIGSVDDLRTAQNADHTLNLIQDERIAHNDVQIVSLAQGQNALVARVGDNTIRITKLESNPMLDPSKITGMMNRAEARKRGQ